jgi:gluconate 2-dehydrogenase alpha chain
MFPADELGPGALAIGVPEYLQRALGGAYAELLPTYKLALAGLDEAARQEWGEPFASLPAERQDSLIARLEQRQIARIEQSEAAGFFELVWQHLREGLFADPIHGGNKDLAGWKLIGFPGAQTGYSAEEQQLDVIVSRPTQSVADVYPQSSR